MQFTFSFLSLTFLSTIFSTTVAVEVFAPKYIFNKGTTTIQMSCSSIEWEKVVATMVNAAGSNRRLGDGGRRLSRACENCGTLCFFIGKGCAGKTQRGLLEEEAHERKLTQCDAKFQAIDAALTSLSVSQTCSNLLNAPRTVTCETLTTDCYINKVSLWNAITEGMIVDNFNATGGTVCQNQKVTFRAHTSFDDGNVKFLAYGSGGYVLNRTETKEPYYMHGNAGTNVHGIQFPKGDYNLSITTQFNSAQKVIRFSSIDC